MTINEVCYHCLKSLEVMNEIDTIEKCIFDECQFPVCSSCARDQHKSIQSWTIKKYQNISSSLICLTINQIFIEKISHEEFASSIQELRENPEYCIYWRYFHEEENIEPQVYTQESHLREVLVMNGEEICLSCPVSERVKLNKTKENQWVISHSRRRSTCTIPAHEFESPHCFWEAFHSFVQTAKKKNLIVIAYFPEIKYDLSEDWSKKSIQAQYETNISLLNDPSEWGLYLFKSSELEFRT